MTKNANTKPPPRIEDPGTDIGIVCEAIDAIDGPMHHLCDVADGVATHVAITVSGIRSDVSSTADGAARSLGLKVLARAHGNGKG